MNGKKTIPLLVIASMILALMPSMMLARASLTALPTPSLYDSTETINYSVVGSLVSTRYGTGTPPQFQEGDTIAVKGNGVQSGTPIYLYWDTVQAWNGVAGLMNQTTTSSSTSYDVWLDVPQATYGPHYLWVTDGPTLGDVVSVEVIVAPYVDTSSSTGQPGNSVTIDYYGFNATTNIRMLWLPTSFLDTSASAPIGFPTAATPTTTWPTVTPSPTWSVGTFDGSTTTFSNTMTTTLVVPFSFKVSVGGTVWAEDNGHGDLVSATTTLPTGVTGISGTINYITGYYSLTIVPAQAVSLGAISAAYNAFSTANTSPTTDPLWISSGTTNSLGTVTSSMTVPTFSTAPTPGTNFAFAAFDGYGTFGESVFTIGPTITVSPTSTPTGSTVYVMGTGFETTTPSTITSITLAEPGMTTESCYIGTSTTASATISVDNTGRFSAPVVVPQGHNIKDDYTFAVTTSAGQTASVDDFMVTALASVSVTPTSAGTGAKITVSGTNYPKISGMTEDVYLFDSTDTTQIALIGTTTLTSSGTFSKAFTLPAEPSAAYTIQAQTSPATGIAPDTAFAIGNLLVALSESSGPVGSTLTVTGSGFSPSGSYNVTLGTSTLVTSGSVLAGGTINSGTLYIPMMAAGTYSLKVTDVTTGIVVTEPFVVTTNTALILTPSTTVPADFNVSVRGNGFKYPVTTSGSPLNDIPIWQIYNKTASGAISSLWSLNVYNASAVGTYNSKTTGAYQSLPATVNGTGTLLGWFILEPGWSYPNGGPISTGTTLSPGTYYLNVTDGIDSTYHTQAIITVKPNLVVCTPTQSTFAIGDTITFTLQHSQGDITPQYGSNIYIYGPDGSLQFKTDDLKNWVSVSDYYVLPYGSQTEGGNPMVLLSSAPLGTWTYTWTGTDSSTIAKGSFTVAQTAPVSSATAQEIGALNKTVTSLSGQVSSVASSVQSLATTVGTLSSSVTAVGTSASAANTAAMNASAAAKLAGTKADAATAAANTAATAANSAASAASSLTTLVYAAIGASIIAAIAAIVALMQISRKIA